MKKLPIKTQQTRQNLIDAFWELYGTKRIEKITVQEISQKAGYNRSTFYQYFHDVYDLLAQLEHSLLPALDTLPPFIPLDATTEQPSLMPFLTFYAEHQQYYTVLLGDHGNPAFARKMKEHLKQGLLHQGGFPDNPPPELDYALEYTLSATIGMLTYWFQNEENISVEKLIRIAHSLANPQGLHDLAQKLQISPLQNQHPDTDL
ncbi:MAG: TetR/AcrR family transcriptional regulator [Culicoidibacterales bacterium]